MRLAGIALGGYYPTPAALAHALAARLRADTPQVFLDPCAGDGAAVADLATAMIPRLTPEAVKLRDRVRATGGYGGATALPDGLDDAEATRVSRAWDARDCTFALVELERDRAAAIRTTFSPVAAHDHLTVTAADAFAVWHKPSGYRFPRALRAGILAVLGADPGTRPGAEDDARDEALPGRVAAALTDTAVDMASRRGALPFASVLYLNPPYDLDAVHGRLEQRFLRRFTGSLRPGGVLVFLVPHHALRASAEFIATHYRDVRCLRFPPAHFAAYRQVVLYGVRRGGSGLDIDGPQGAEGDGAPGLRPDPVVLARILAWADAEPGPEGQGLPECPELTPGLAPGEAPYTLPRYTFDSKHGSYNAAMKWAGAWDVPSVHGRIEAVDVPHIRAFFDPWSSRRKGGAAVSAQAAYGALTGRGDPIAGILPPSLADVLQRDYPVVMPPKPAHIAAGIAAGVFNGEALAPDGGPGEGPTLLVKGAFRREFATISTRENKDGHVVAEERVQQPSLVVTVCDLANGEYHTLASSPTATLPEGPFTSADVAGMSVGDLLTRYGRGLLATLRARCPVLYDPRTADAEGAGADGYTGAAWTLPPTRRPPYPAQTHAIRAMVKVLAAGPVRRDGARGATVPYRGRRGATVALLGEVGCGKSLVSLVAAMALGARRILVLCPPHLLDGWREQVVLTCHHATVHVLRSPAEVDAWATERPEDLYPEGVPADAVSIGILSREAAKLGHGVEGVGRCPDCGFDSHGGAASRVLAAALSEAEKDTALAANAGAHAARIAQALAASRTGGGGGDAARVAEGIAGAVAVLEGKRAARIQRLTDTRDDEEAEERNARLRVLCPAPLPLRPRDRIASALGALAMALGRWDTGLREYASSAALLRAWTRLDAENHVAILATVAGADEADRAGALTRADKEQRTAGGRATLDAPGPAYGRATPAPVSATHRALGLAVEAMALAYAERGSTWGGSTPGAPRVDDVWLALALLPDSVRLDVVVGLQRRLAPAPVIRANGELTHRCPWGLAWDTRNTAWIMAHVLAWSALLCASREVADEIAWTWPGYPGTRADAPDHDPRVALPKRETARVLLPHASTSWAMKAPTNGGGDDPEGAVHGDLHVGPCAWRDVSAGDAPASMRLAAVRLMVRAHTPAPSRVRNAYGYGASSPESTTPSEASITLAGTWRRVRAFLTTAARWAPAPVGTPVDARLYDPGALVTGDDAGRLPAVTAPRLARVMARLRRGAADAGDAGADAAVGDDGAGTEGGKGRTRGRGAATATGRKARPGRCNAALYQASPEPRRAALARYIVRRHPGCFDFLVADECFPGDTPVATPTGPRRIDALRVGDVVWGWDANVGRVPRRVLRLKRSINTRGLVRVTTPCGFVDCTPDHKVWSVSAGQYTEARNLLRSDPHADYHQDVPRVHRPLFNGSTLGAGEGVLYQGVRGSVARNGLGLAEDRDRETLHGDVRVVRQGRHGYVQVQESRGLLSVLQLQARVLVTGDARQEQRVCPGACDRRVSGSVVRAGTEAECRPCDSAEDGRRHPGSADAESWWKRRTRHEGAGQFGRCARVAYGGTCGHGRQGLAYGVAGHRAPGLEGGGGVRWPLAHDQDSAGTRWSQGQDDDSPRVGHAAVSQRHDPRGPSRCRGALSGGREVRVTAVTPSPRSDALVVYDLEVEDTHNYFAGGILVSNCHEFAGDRTAQFMAFQRLAGLGAPTILATGSVMNGYAESLFNLWQRFPEFRAEFPREARRAFVERYGYIRVEVKDVDKDTGKVVEFGSVSDRVVRQTREVGNAPGVLPLFILRHLLPRAVTLHKTDLALSLPPCHQRVAFVPVDPDAAKLHAAMLSALVAEVKRGRFQPGLAGKLFGMLSESPSHLDRCTADVGNRPDGAYVVAYPESAGPNAGALVWNGEALDPRRVLAKEAWLLRTIRREVAEGRRVLVLAWHVELMPRLQRLIAHCLADVLAPEEYGAPELPGGFAWRGPVGGGGDAPEGVDPIDEVPAGYWSGLDAATGLPLPGPAAGGTGAGPGGATKGRGKGTGGGAGAGSTTGPTLAAAARGKGARGGARPVFPTSLPAAAIDRLCPALNAGKVAAADRIAWINERVVRTGAKVMVVQPVAVKTGINNLVHFSTQVWMQNPGCDATTLRQAVGRVDRIGQGADETRIYLGVYDVRSQRAAHTLLMRKAAVALAADGLDGESALNAAGVGESAGAMSALTVGRQLYDLIAADG